MISPSAFRIGETVSETSMIGAVLAPPLRLVVIDRLAASDSAEDLLGVLDALGRHEHRDVACR